MQDKKYTYDKLGRLVREDNKSLYKSVFFTYDNNGNITGKEETSYKTGDYVTGSGTVKRYTYDNYGRLTSYNGENCVYDSMGNPTTYRGKSAVWQYGRRLMKLGNNTYLYDALGKRIRKNGTKFVYDGKGRLIKQGSTFEFYYDDNGVIGFKYSGKNYTYRKNVQGDVTAILDGNGNEVVTYLYDAWGNHATFGSDSVLGSLNPFRYRSYYFDTETNLYYLQTRYYDPEVGRFLNMDDLQIAFLGKNYINGLNLCSYCFNNPVMYIDDGGLFPKFNDINKRLRYRIDNKGLDSEHIVVQYQGKEYQRHKNPKTRTGRHGKDNTKIPNRAKDLLIKAGVPKEYLEMTKAQLPYFHEGMNIVQIPKWQERFNLSIIPPYREGINIIDLPIYQEGISIVNLQKEQEGFSLSDGALIGGLSVAAIGLIALAFFTGGQSLWGFVFI